MFGRSAVHGSQNDAEHQQSTDILIALAGLLGLGLLGLLPLTLLRGRFVFSAFVPQNRACHASFVTPWPFAYSRERTRSPR